MYYVDWRNDYCSDSCTDYVIIESFNDNLKKKEEKTWKNKVLKLRMKGVIHR